MALGVGHGIGRRLRLLRLGLGVGRLVLAREKLLHLLLVGRQTPLHLMRQSLRLLALLALGEEL